MVLGMEWQPLFRLPLLDVFAPVFTRAGEWCEDFEYNYWKCQEAFGRDLSLKHCDLERRDYFECDMLHKRFNRIMMIRQERIKKFLKGELDRPFERGPNPNVVQQDFYHRVWGNA